VVKSLGGTRKIPGSTRHLGRGSRTSTYSWGVHLTLPLRKRVPPANAARNELLVCQAHRSPQVEGQVAGAEENLKKPGPRSAFSEVC
jgi:hypothetical protein